MNYEILSSHRRRILGGKIRYRLRKPFLDDAGTEQVTIENGDFS
jgi:hypothetical protein